MLCTIFPRDVDDCMNFFCLLDTYVIYKAVFVKQYIPAYSVHTYIRVELQESKLGVYKRSTSGAWEVGVQPRNNLPSKCGHTEPRSPSPTTTSTTLILTIWLTHRNHSPSPSTPPIPSIWPSFVLSSFADVHDNPPGFVPKSGAYAGPSYWQSSSLATTLGSFSDE